MDTQVAQHLAATYGDRAFSVGRTPNQCFGSSFFLNSGLGAGKDADPTRSGSKTLLRVLFSNICVILNLVKGGYDKDVI